MGTTDDFQKEKWLMKGILSKKLGGNGKDIRT